MRKAKDEFRKSKTELIEYINTLYGTSNKQDDYDIQKVLVNIIKNNLSEDETIQINKNKEKYSIEDKKEFKISGSDKFIVLVQIYIYIGRLIYYYMQKNNLEIIYDNIFSKENSNSIYNIIYNGKTDGSPKQRLVKSEEEKITLVHEDDILKIIFEKDDDDRVMMMIVMMMMRVMMMKVMMRVMMMMMMIMMNNYLI